MKFVCVCVGGGGGVNLALQKENYRGDPRFISKRYYDSPWNKWVIYKQ